MAKQVNIHAAKTHFSKLCEEAEAGAEIVIARSGKPILKLVRVEEEQTPALKADFGFAKGMITGYTDEEFDALDEEIWASWHEKEFDFDGYETKA
ncbi:MAG: type II toxin-antitoxin system Phd/YefM family antitoxin [Rhodoluna sp.]|nr:type II toxin-antitoxin system Phd/YefM family antitoxin [Rhodoluna sp.]